MSDLNSSSIEHETVDGKVAVGTEDASRSSSVSIFGPQSSIEQVGLVPVASDVHALSVDADQPKDSEVSQAAGVEPAGSVHVVDESSSGGQLNENHHTVVHTKPLPAETVVSLETSSVEIVSSVTPSSAPIKSVSSTSHPGISLSTPSTPINDSAAAHGSGAIGIVDRPVAVGHSSSKDENEASDDFVISPDGQNAIVERSPGGRYVRFMEKLGSGASKDVYRAYDTQEGIEVAWNVVSLAEVPKTERNRIVNEVRLLERLHHQNIISFHGSWVNRERLEVHFVTEILSSGTLKSFIKKVQVIRWKIAKRWAVQILKGLEYLHSQDPPVIHRDLKCENIFINGTSGDLRIGDLGLSTVHRNGKVLSVLGTPEFMAPDMYEEASYDEKVDIYSFGMCMLEIFTKEIPYKECSNPIQIYKKVSNGDLPSMLSRLQSRHAREFILLCLGHKDENGKFVRPTATELLKHDFLNQRANDEDEVLVDPPLQEKTILETPPNGGMSSEITVQSRSAVSEAASDRSRERPAPVQVPRESVSTDDMADRFDEMPEVEKNIRKVKVMMGRGQVLHEDEGIPADGGSVASQNSSLPEPNGIPIVPSTETQVTVSPPPTQESSGQYLIAAAIIENDVSDSTYDDDIMKLLVTLPFEGQAQNVQFEYDLVSDDPIQVAKEMVSELGIPADAVLEISATVSGLACKERVRRDKNKNKGQGKLNLASMEAAQHRINATQDTKQQSLSLPPPGAPSVTGSNQVADYSAGSSLGPINSPMLALGQGQVQAVSTESGAVNGQINGQHSHGHVPSQMPQHQPVQPQQLNQHGNLAPQFGYDPGQATVSKQASVYNTQQVGQTTGQILPDAASVHSFPTSYVFDHSQASGKQILSDAGSVSSVPTYVYDAGQTDVQQSSHRQGHLVGRAQSDGHPPNHLYNGIQSSQPRHSQPMSQQMPKQHIQGGENQKQSHAFLHHSPQIQPQHIAHHLNQVSQDGQQHDYGHSQVGLQQSRQLPGQVLSHQASSDSMSGTGFTNYDQNSTVQRQSRQIIQPQQFGFDPSRNQQVLQQGSHVISQNVPIQAQLMPNNVARLNDTQADGQQASQYGYDQGNTQNSQTVLQATSTQQHQMSIQNVHQTKQTMAEDQSLGTDHSVHVTNSQVAASFSGQPNLTDQAFISSSLANGAVDQVGVGAHKALVNSPNPHLQPQGMSNPAHINGIMSTDATSQQRSSSTSQESLGSQHDSKGSHGKVQGPANVMTYVGQASMSEDSERQMVPSDGGMDRGFEEFLQRLDANNDESLVEEMRKLNEDYQNILRRAQTVYDKRMDNLQRNKIEKEAQHQKTLERHQREQLAFEKRLQQEEIQQSRRIGLLQKEWDRKRDELAMHKKMMKDEALQSDQEKGKIMASGYNDAQRKVVAGNLANSKVENIVESSSLESVGSEK